MNNKFVKISIFYLIAYASMMLLPGIVVHPVDWIFELITGIHYVDGWTKGLMAYMILAVAMPLLYIIVLVVYWFRRSSAKEAKTKTIGH